MPAMWIFAFKAKGGEVHDFQRQRVAPLAPRGAGDQDVDLRRAVGNRILERHPGATGQDRSEERGVLNAHDSTLPLLEPESGIHTRHRRPCRPAIGT